MHLSQKAPRSFLLLPWTLECSRTLTLFVHHQDRLGIAHRNQPAVVRCGSHKPYFLLWLAPRRTHDPHPTHHFLVLARPCWSYLEDANMRVSSCHIAQSRLFHVRSTSPRVPRERPHTDGETKWQPSRERGEERLRKRRRRFEKGDTGAEAEIMPIIRADASLERRNNLMFLTFGK